MKKILNFTKRNLKVIVAFILGIMFSGTFVYATSTMLYASSEVEYDNTTVAIEKSAGVNVANVQEAIEALYEKASNASTDCAQGYVKQNVTSTSYVCGPPPTAAETISTKEGIETVSYGKIYTGASPDNYVLFNCTNDSDPSTCEEWRIIGVYTDATKGDMLKIVRGTPSTTSQVYRSSGNAWNESNIQSYLVNTYYPTLSTTAKGMIEESATWKVGAASYTANAGAAYTSEGGTTWTGKIGLVASYEYLYAAGSSCQNTAGGGSSSSDFRVSCSSQDWLWPVLTNNKSTYGYGWFMSPASDYTSNALHVSYSSGTVLSNGATTSFAASPVVYLKSTVTITGGNGGSGVANAYRLG